jgi:hypothetical protein
MPEVASDTHYLSQMEVELAVRQLMRGAELARLVAWATISINRNRLMPTHEPLELLNEAYVRVCSRNRPFRRDANLRRFLMYLMRSIAWRWRKAGTKETATEDRVLFALQDHRAPVETQQEILMRKDRCRQVCRSLQDDPHALTLFVGMIAGLTQGQLAAELKLSETATDSKRRKIWRRIEGLIE